EREPGEMTACRAPRRCKLSTSTLPQRLLVLRKSSMGGSASGTKGAEHGFKLQLRFGKLLLGHRARHDAGPRIHAGAGAVHQRGPNAHEEFAAAAGVHPADRAAIESARKTRSEERRVGEEG